MQQIGTASFSRVLAWWERAMAAPDVRRFMSFEPYIHEPRLGSPGWDNEYHLSDDSQTLLKLGIDRADRVVLTMSVWSLHASRFARALAAGNAIYVADLASRRLNARAVQFAVHSTNADCLRLAHRKFGKPWGICPEEAWDGLLCRYVDGHRFQLLLGGS